MSVTILRAEHKGPFIEFEVCPNAEDGDCKCAVKDHKVLQYTEDAPEGFEGSWLEKCSDEALLLVASEKQTNPHTLGKLIGKSL